MRLRQNGSSDLSNVPNVAADKAGRAYWDQVWDGQDIPAPFAPAPLTRHNYADQAFHAAFLRLFGASDQTGKTLLEVGAARSAWLPYFADVYGFAVTGLDYSELGCAQAQAILDRAGVTGEVILADLFAPPETMLAAYDVVISFGVVEHFDDTAATVTALARFLRPGGMLISVVPNLSGIGGFLQKRLCRDIYDVHLRLDQARMQAAHQHAGLDVRVNHYFIGGGFTTMNMGCWRGSPLYPLLSRVPTLLTMPFLALQRGKMPLRPNRLTSPYLVCVAERPA